MQQARLDQPVFVYDAVSGERSAFAGSGEKLPGVRRRACSVPALGTPGERTERIEDRAAAEVPAGEAHRRGPDAAPKAAAGDVLQGVAAAGGVCPVLVDSWAAVKGGGSAAGLRGEPDRCRRVEPLALRSATGR